MAHLRLAQFRQPKPKENGYTEWFTLELPIIEEYIEEIGIALYEVYGDSKFKDMATSRSG